ncbi:hypothetical protein [Methanolobus vulcani]|uniref:Asparagine synthase (Glutamine-hydrolysing) n=1 Tax=Methanolobus vulcani TaxID=38026 RepID=A0A7Z8KLR4_9EURY|nr:hypothetical protein [Methanolobus vulcani]TQD23850.1 hypothetical protein FKV42_11590 [Methanolobus vulcani]
MNRIIAFMIVSNNINCSNDGNKPLQYLCQRFNKNISKIKTDYFTLHVVYEGKIGELLNQENDNIHFCLGQYNNKWKSAYVLSDRFLLVTISNDRVICTSDYVGSIPVFYSLREGVVISNIEPVVITNSSTSEHDISYDSFFGFMKFSHLIWEETLYKHIFSQEPDSRYTYTLGTKEPKKTDLKSIKASNDRIYKSDIEVAKDLYRLNKDLVQNALLPYKEIVLPLSAGYDSRMIIAACSENEGLLKRLKCFTYGSENSVEVIAAKELCKVYGVYWRHIELPCQFLERHYLNPILNIFGSSLHLHGMYQLEFWEKIKPFLETDSPVLTSGFMTGVPAGQHVSKLKIQNKNSSLTEAMENFSQSKYWKNDELIRAFDFFDQKMLDLAEKRFKKAFDRFDGRIDQKSVLFDVWTRQRNFISYHPRTLEWEVPVISPHMTAVYQNFFMTLNEKHLKDRKAIELMFQYHYPDAAAIISNSNGTQSLTNHLDNMLLFYSRIMKKINLELIIPKKYLDQPVLFDIPALSHSKKSGLFPLFDSKRSTVLKQIFSEIGIEQIYDNALNGDLKAYGKLCIMQAVAYGLNLIQSEDE